MFRLALIFPRKAAADGLFDGRTIGIIRLNLLNWIPFLCSYPLILYHHETQIDALMIIAMLPLIAFALLLSNWICPRILYSLLCVRVHGGLPKRTHRQRENTSRITMAECRQLVLFSAFIGIIFYGPYVVFNHFFSIPNFIDILCTVFGLSISTIWLYKAVCPAYVSTNNKAVIKLLAYWGGTLALALLCIIIIVVVGLVFDFEM
jgi:hypothetical protein